MADEVSVDSLTELWRCGAVRMPQVAAQYGEMSQALHRSAQSEDSAFGDHSLSGAPSYVTWGGPLAAAWQSLRNLVQDEIAVRTHQNLMAAGRVLTEIADAYASADYLSADELATYRDTIEGYENSQVPDDRPPADVPQAPSSQDPHPP